MNRAGGKRACFLDELQSQTHCPCALQAGGNVPGVALGSPSLNSPKSNKKNIKLKKLSQVAKYYKLYRVSGACVGTLTVLPLRFHLENLQTDSKTRNLHSLGLV